MLKSNKWRPDRSQRILVVASCWILVAAIIVDESLAQTGKSLNFSSDVLPILSRACFPCHGPDEKTRQGDVRLDIRAGALRIDQPVIQPGNAGASRLFQRLTSDNPETRMPPADFKQQLTMEEIRLIQRWINEGAAWSEHWSFLAPRQYLPPEVHERVRSRGPIDDFILDRLERRGLQASSEAVKESQLRRVTLDLVGLPPSLDEQMAFLADDRSDAYERVVDRLLASPHYGEHWGRHWLDVARYADSSGFEGDAPRVVWKYRDWVLKAINDDLPFDDFVIMQLAGDLLPNASVDDQIATGFLLNSQQDGGSEPSRLDAVVDRVNTIGAVFLGLTVGCAQCHAHKFDPLSQRDYYGLFAFVNTADEFTLEFASPEQLARRDALAAQLASLKAELTAYAAKWPAESLKSDPGYLERNATIKLLSDRIPLFDSAIVLRPASSGRKTTTFLRGDYAHPGECVAPDVPGVLPPLPVGTRTRLDLALWLVNSEQPLTARVTVNRIWQELFGRGLVETENDFGTQGARPTHPELLDWLAFEFSRNGWRSKRLIRRMIESATYRQTSHRRSDVEKIDPDNRWLARQSRLRLAAEPIRDSALAAGGLLSTKIGGPSVFPFQHDGIMVNRATPAAWTISTGEDRYRRGLYTYYWRLTPHPQLQVFDTPDAIATCTRRQTSNTPLQALTLLNDLTFTEAADGLARQLVAREFESDIERLNHAFRLCLCRDPDEEECRRLRRALESARFRREPTLPGKVGLSGEKELATWTQLARIILNLEEFIVRE